MDESHFFREATLRICGSLEIEKAMQQCLRFLARYLPATHMAFHIYDRELGIVETVAMATIDNARSMALRTPLSSQGMQQVEAQRAMRTKLVARARDDAVAGPVARQLGVENFSVLILDLALEGSFVGTVSVFSEAEIHFNPHHVKLISMLNEPFAIALANSLRYRELQALQDMLADDNRYLQDELRSMTGEAVIGAEFGLRPVMELVRQVAPLASPVLLLGETGVGKEVLANAIHNLSPRADGPFIRVNCGAIAESLMDSELFGHEKGAFTGAVSQKRGRFERANGGTIFLDEIGELPPEMQVRLLRVLQEKEIERVGGGGNHSRGHPGYCGDPPRPGADACRRQLSGRSLFPLAGVSHCHPAAPTQTGRSARPGAAFHSEKRHGNEIGSDPPPGAGRHGPAYAVRVAGQCP